jgi:hypothetical protein
MPRATGWTPSGLCSLFVCDIASFGDLSRTDLHRHKIRTALYDGLRRSFDDTGVPYAACYHEDRGDGALVAVPPMVDTTVLLTSLVQRLRAAVRQHNDVSVRTAQMQLRLAVHTGIVHSDAEGLVGTAVNYAFRILEAPQLKQVLRRTGAELALITSERVYDDVIRHGLGLVNPADYDQVELEVKETRTCAWITVPGRSAPVRAVPTAPDPRELLPAQAPAQALAPVTVADRSSGLEDIVDCALRVRQLHSRHLRDQIVAELPLTLATEIRRRRSADERTDLTAIISTCEDHVRGLTELLRVVRQFAGDSTQLDDLRKAVDELRPT